MLKSKIKKKTIKKTRRIGFYLKKKNGFLPTLVFRGVGRIGEKQSKIRKERARQTNVQAKKPDGQEKERKTPI